MPIPNQVHLVASVKAELVARGVLPAQQATNCDAFQITARVAWRLRTSGAALLPKAPAQNGCTLTDGPYAGKRFSHDSIGFPDGWVDLLANAGPPSNANTPAWQWHDGAPADPGFWPWDLDAGLVTPLPAPPPVVLPQPDESGLPTVWSAAPPGSLQWYTDMAAALEQVYRVLLRRPADWGGAGNWVYHILEDSREPAWVIARFKESDEYQARRGTL